MSRNIKISVILGLILSGGIGLFYLFGEPSDNKGRRELAAKYHINEYFIDDFGVLHDRVELTDKYKNLKEEVERLVDAEMAKTQSSHPENMRNIITKKIWKEKFAIDWRSEQEMNPWVKLD